MIGYLSQISDFKGLDLLVEAFIELKRQKEFNDLRLRVAGDKITGGSDFLAGIEQRLQDAGVTEDVEIIRQFDREARGEFLQSLTLLSVPEKHGDAISLVGAVHALVGALPLPNGGSPEELQQRVVILERQWSPCRIEPDRPRRPGGGGLGGGGRREPSQDEGQTEQHPERSPSACAATARVRPSPSPVDSCFETHSAP